MARLRLGDDSGFTIIEILVAALLVASVGGLTVNALGNANHASGRERARSQAAALAQQDLDQMRSISPATLADSAGTSTTRGVDFGPLHFDVTRTVSWQSDSSTASATCTGSTPPSYLQITSSVDGPSLGGLKPQAASSLVAMPAGSTGGVLTVTVKDQSGSALSGVTINATSPGGGTQTAATNSNGCALFTTLPNGTYTVSAQKTGYVDNTSNATPTVTNQHVFTAQTTTVNFTMAQGGTIKATFWTNGNGWTQATSPAEKWDEITYKFGGTSKIAGATRVANGTLGSQTSITTPVLWPGTYTVFPGGCSSENSPTAGLSATVTGGGQATVAIPLEALNPTIQFNGAAQKNAHVKFIRTDVFPCTTPLNTPDVGLTDASGHVPQFIGLPPGTYAVCAWYTSGAFTYYRKSGNKTVAAFASTPAAQQTFNVNMTTTSPTC